MDEDNEPCVFYVDEDGGDAFLLAVVEEFLLDGVKVFLLVGAVGNNLLLLSLSCNSFILGENLLTIDGDDPVIVDGVVSSSIFQFIMMTIIFLFL